MSIKHSLSVPILKYETATSYVSRLTGIAGWLRQMISAWITDFGGRILCEAMTSCLIKWLQSVAQMLKI